MVQTLNPVSGAEQVLKNLNLNLNLNQTKVPLPGIEVPLGTWLIPGPGYSRTALQILAWGPTPDFGIDSTLVYAIKLSQTLCTSER